MQCSKEFNAEPTFTLGIGLDFGKLNSDQRMVIKRKLFSYFEFRTRRLMTSSIFTKTWDSCVERVAPVWPERLKGDIRMV
jgi:hypothetical protein